MGCSFPPAVSLSTFNDWFIHSNCNTFKRIDFKLPPSCRRGQHAILLYRYIITEITPVPHCSTTPYPQFQRSVACCNGSLNYSTPTNGAYQPLHGFPSRLDTQLYYRFCLYNPDNMHHMCEWEGDRHFHRRGDTENPHEALLQPRVGMVANVA
jgi:hypothetical protein